MTQAVPSASGLVRVTVASGTRRVDLVLPGAVPVAELVPELARSVGLLDAATAHGGYRLVTADGRRLETDAGLTLQGVDDGAVITVAAGVDEAPVPVYDDVVEAMTDVVEHDLMPWDPAAGRRTALWAATLLMALGAAALCVQSDARVAGTTAAIVSAVLVAGAIVLSRAQREPEAAVAVAWMGTGYAAVAGLLLAPAGEFLGLSALCAGGGALIAGMVSVIGLDQGRTLLVPGGVVGAVFAATGLLVHGTEADPGIVLVVVLTAVVLAGSVFPWLALGATSTTPDPLYSPADITAEPREIDVVRVAADARTAHEILVAISATVGLLLVLVSPLAVDRGTAGTLLAVVAALVVVLRTRQYRTGSEVLVGMVSGILGLAVTAGSVLVLHESWRPTTALVLAVAGAALLVATLSPAGPSVRRGRFGDLLETVSLVALLPLLVLASGLTHMINS